MKRKKGHEKVGKTLKMKKGEGMALDEKVMKQDIEMWHDVLTFTCSLVFALRYNIKGSVASLRAMPTPFFFVWLSIGPQVRMSLAAINFKLEDYMPFISRDPHQLIICLILYY